MRDKIKEISRTWRSDFQYSTLLSSTLSAFISFGFTVFNGVMGIVYLSLWNGAICVYYMLLSLIRSILVKTQRKMSDSVQSGDKNHNRKVYIATHILLLLMDVSLIVPIAVMVEGKRSYTYGLIPAIAMAAYTTYRITMSILNFLKARKSDSPIVAELRMINLTDSLLALLTLQNALINANGGMDADMTVLTAWTGGGIFTAIVILTVFSFTKVKRIP